MDFIKFQSVIYGIYGFVYTIVVHKIRVLFCSGVFFYLGQGRRNRGRVCVCVPTLLIFFLFPFVYYYDFSKPLVLMNHQCPSPTHSQFVSKRQIMV